MRKLAGEQGVGDIMEQRVSASLGQQREVDREGGA
jgi:hypothetical protein